LTKRIYPLRFKPVYKDYLWGGDRIIRAYGRDEPPGVYAESWEVSARAEGMSVVADGPLGGRSLLELVREMGSDLVGSGPAGRDPGTFPLLIKLIDARERLSVQVHPDNEAAAQWGGEAKTEMWYVLEADPGAAVFAGLRPGVDPAKFQEALDHQRLEELLAVVPVRRGDAVFMPGGRVHAIDRGCLLLEVQQNSDTTYRIYDWGRVGPDGKPRPLHVEEAMRVIRWHDEGAAKVQPRRLGFMGESELWEVLNCAYFRMERLVLKDDWEAANDGHSFHVLFAASGQTELAWDEKSDVLRPGTTCLLPAALPAYRLLPRVEESEVIRVTVL